MHVLDAALTSNLTSKHRTAPERRAEPETALQFRWSVLSIARPLAGFAILGLLVSTLELASSASPAPLQAQAATKMISGLAGISGERSKSP